MIGKTWKAKHNQMDWLLSSTAACLLLGISMGLFLSICLYGYKQMCLTTNVVKKELLIDKEASKISNIEANTPINSEKYGNSARKKSKHEDISGNSLTIFLNDLASTMDKTKYLEEKIKQNEISVKKLITEKKALEQRIGKLEDDQINNTTYTEMNCNRNYALRNKLLYCACEPGKTQVCL